MEEYMYAVERGYGRSKEVHAVGLSARAIAIWRRSVREKGRRIDV